MLQYIFFAASWFFTLSPQEQSNAMGKVTERVAIRFAKKHGLTTGENLWLHYSKHSCLGTSDFLYGQQAYTKQEALELMQLFINDFSTAIYQHRNTYPEVCNLSILTERISVKMSFWDKEWNRQLPPYVAEVRVRNGNMYIFYADPVTQKITTADEVPYQLPNFTN